MWHQTIKQMYGPILWNNVPLAIRTSPTVTLFKKNLKTPSSFVPCFFFVLFCFVLFLFLFLFLFVCFFLCFLLIFLCIYFELYLMSFCC